MKLDNKEHIQDWQQEEFYLVLYDTNRTNNYGKNILAYQLYDKTYGEQPIFQGDDFACSPLHAIDSDNTIASLLGFLSLQPGDTDQEYFQTYTPKQLQWAKTRAQELQILVYEIEHANQQ